MTGILFTTRGNPASPEINNGSITELQKNTNILLPRPNGG